MSPSPKTYTAEEANRLIPQIAGVLPELRALRGKIIQTRDKYDVEELTSYGMKGQHAKDAKDTMDRFKHNIRTLEHEFETKIRLFEEFGCELKALDPGLVDFYSMKDGQLVYLCWREDETHVAYWHGLDGGFAGRQPL